MIGVVIPYYQREPGVLRRALASVAAQRGCPLPVHVIVVDDGSPAPGAAEVDAATSMPWPVDAERQANAGPAAARNAGLDRLPPGTRYVAFLDSDDEWSDDHLARAVAALEAGAGFDLYFANHLQLGQTTGAFERAGRIDPAAHPALDAVPAGLHEYRGDLLDQIIRGNVIGTSTVVYRQPRFPAVRFRTEFLNAGEDYLFWMDLTKQGARACFSSRPEATYGRGVNVYSGVAWGSEPYLLRVHNEMRFRKTVRREFELTTGQRDHVRGSIRRLRADFAGGLLHRLTHLKLTSARLLLRHLLLDPASYGRLPTTAWSLLVARK